MWLTLLLACMKPVDVQMRVVDAVHGAARADVVIVWQAQEARCVREATSDPSGLVKASLCPDVRYEVMAPADGVSVWPPVAGIAGELPTTLQVVDQTRTLALVGGGVVPLPDAVDVRRVRPKGHEAGLAVPAVLPVLLPTWSAGQGLFVPEGVAVEAIPVVPTETLELEEGGPLQPWFALGARIDAGGQLQDVPAANPAGTLEVPGGVVWTGLPAGTYALWDGQAPRVPLLEVE